MIALKVAFCWLILGTVFGLILGRIIANADRRTDEQSCENFAECDGVIPTVHNMGDI